MSETQINPEQPKMMPAERQVEVTFETGFEQPPSRAELPVVSPARIPVVPPNPSVQALDVMPAQTPELVREVEHVLAQGLDETYRQLDPATQVKFKLAGEETATKISVLLGDVKDQTKKILQLIIVWLRIIPGVNQYFLEQEAKIKADKLLRLKTPRL